MNEEEIRKLQEKAEIDFKNWLDRTSLKKLRKIYDDEFSNDPQEIRWANKTTLEALKSDMIDLRQITIDDISTQSFYDEVVNWHKEVFA